MKKRKKKASRGEGGNAAAGAAIAVAIPLRKKIAFGALFTVAGLVLVELAAFVLLHALGMAKKDEVAVWNPTDPERREVVMPGDVGRDAVALLDETVKFNMFNNRTTRPDPRYMFRVRPGFGKERKQKSPINSDGFRGYEFDFEDDASLRILLFGDSCAFGWEILETHKTMAFVMEKLLERDLGPAQVFNLGQPGFSTYQASLVFDDWFDRIDPDYVIYYGGWNDLHKANITDARMHSVLKWTMSPSTGFLRRTNTYRLCAATATRIRWAKVKSKSEMAQTRIRVPVDDALAHLAAMVARAKEKERDFLIVLPPFSAKRAPGTPESLEKMMAYRERLQEAFGSSALMLRFEEMEYERPDSPRFFLEIDGYHPNAEGAALMGWGMSRAIINLENSKGGAGL